MFAMRGMQGWLCEVIGEVREAVQRVHLAADAIGSGNGALSERSERQAQSLQARATSIDELADDTLNISGFASLVAGKVLSGDRQDPYYRYPCPCFIADYGHGAVYAPTWQVKQESKVGVQGTYAITPKLSATAQMVGRGVDGVKTRLEWAYLSYDVSDSWTVQAGRKRLPIYYYSDFQDVGYAYTWVRPPTDIYGWEIVNYNGINATYRADWAGWAVKSNVFFGREDSHGNLMQRLYYDDPQNVTWKKILGGDLVLSRGMLTTRAIYIQSKVEQYSQVDQTSAYPDTDPKAMKQRIYGLAANLDNQKEGAVTEAFRVQVLKKNAAQFKAYWAQQVFTGGGKPRPLEGDDAVLKYVAETPGGIGYVEAGKTRAGVRMLKR
jgi:hypothetical protein